MIYGNLPSIPYRQVVPPLTRVNIVTKEFDGKTEVSIIRLDFRPNQQDLLQIRFFEVSVFEIDDNVDPVNFGNEIVPESDDYGYYSGDGNYIFAEVFRRISPGNRLCISGYNTDKDDDKDLKAVVYLTRKD